MKNIRLIILILITVPLVTLAQKNELLLGLSAGINIPTGEFASTNYHFDENDAFIPEGQFAKLGSAFDFSANYRLGYFLGFSGRIMGGTNKIDNEAYSIALNSLEDYNISVASKGWGNAGAFLGAYFVIPTQFFYFDMRIMGGYINLFSPELTYFVETIVSETKATKSVEEFYTREKYNAGAFAYNIGLGVKYNFSSNKFLLLSGDYMSSNIRKNDIKTINPFTKEEEFVNMNVDYRSISVTLGIGYIF